jgi:hypothetical protein
MASTITMSLSQRLSAIAIEAEIIDVDFVDLLAADILRFRRIAETAVPSLTDWQWKLLSHLLLGLDQRTIVAGSTALPDVGTILAAIDTFAGAAAYDEKLRANTLRQAVLRWTPLTIAGIVFRLRADLINAALED